MEKFVLIVLGVLSISLWELLKTGYRRLVSVRWNRQALQHLFDFPGRVVLSRSVVHAGDKLLVRDPDTRISSSLTHLLAKEPVYDDSVSFIDNPSAHLIVVGSPRYNPQAEAIQRHYELPFEYVFASTDNDPGRRILKIITEYGDELTSSVDHRESGNSVEVDYGVLLIGTLGDEKRLLWISGIHGPGTTGVFHYIQSCAPGIQAALKQVGGEGCCWLLRIRYRLPQAGDPEIVDVELLGNPRAVKKRAADRQPKVLVCDLGGVLMYFERARTYRAIAHHIHSTHEHIQEVVEQSDLRERYELGQLSDDDFCTELTTLLGCDSARLPTELLREYWGDIFWPNPEIAGALRYLKARPMRLVLLSNTNPLHYQYVLRDYPEESTWPSRTGTCLRTHFASHPGKRT